MKHDEMQCQGGAASLLNADRLTEGHALEMDGLNGRFTYKSQKYRLFLQPFVFDSRNIAH